MNFKKTLLGITAFLWLAVVASNTFANNTTSETNKPTEYFKAHDCTKADVPVCGVINYSDGTIAVKDFKNLCELTKEKYYNPFMEGDCSIVNNESHKFFKLLTPAVINEVVKKDFNKKPNYIQSNWYKRYISDFEEQLKPIKAKKVEDRTDKEKRAINVINGVIMAFKTMKYYADFGDDAIWWKK